MPVEHLRSKKHELQTRLLSRKRKLSELFSLTAYPLQVTDQAAYKQQLQAFHDANNLERGRRFDESTLPPRSPIVVDVRKDKSQNIVKSSQCDQENLPPAKVHPKSAVSSPKPEPKHVPQPTLQSLPIATTNGDDKQSPPKADAEAANLDLPGKSDGLLPAAKGLPEATNGSLTPSARDQSKSSRAASKEPVNDSMVVDEKDSDQSSSTAKVDLTNRRDTSAEPHPGRNLPVLAPVVPTVEAQSSPSSSNPPDSSNTPAPTAASPGTSPGVDAPLTAPDLPVAKDAEGRGQKTQEVSGPAGAGVSGIQEAAASVDVEMTGTGTEEAEPSRLTSVADGPTAGPEKPTMRIDTKSEGDSYLEARNSGIVESPAPITAVGTPGRKPPMTPSTQEPSKRATRISSGVLQKKSVSEILGEAPKAVTPNAESPSPFGVSSPHGRHGDRERRDKSRSQLATVYFAKRDKAQNDQESTELVRASGAETQRSPQQRDYLYTLFENKAHSMSRQSSMSYLIQNAHKTLSTQDHLVDYELSAECRILKRLYQLQEKQRWALRQHKRAAEASRPTSHWDYLLDHVKWLRADFRGERRWKYAAARDMAEACAEWVAASPEVRRTLQVRVQPPKILAKPDELHDVTMEDGPGPSLSSQPTPELVPSNEDDSMSDDIGDPRDIQLSAPPAAIFSLGPSDFSFTVDKTPAFDKLLNELPLYGPAAFEPEAKSDLAERLDAKWRLDIVPVSRWTTEKLPVRELKPPAKRSRYNYELERSPKKKSAPLPPEDTHVALFAPEYKPVRERIHPGHSFRPPSEHPMPTQAFFETRSSSQWTATEDDELRKLVKDYSYNWSLISSCLAPRSSYTSGADRRTPWECFERWIGLEGLPADMSKTTYFKTYSGRIEAAGRHVAAQIEEAQRRVGANVQIPARKRTTQPVRVERKRGQRHLAMLDAMRKLAKKRETALQKQQHQADLAAMRKVNDANVPKPAYKTPAEFSQLKQEREQKMAERQEIYRQQLIAHQRATAQQQRGQNAQPNGIPNGMPQPQPGVPMRGPPSAGGMPSMPNGNLQMPNGHQRPHPGMMAMQANVPLPPGMLPKGMTPAQVQAQMQAQMARGTATSPQQMRMLQEANRVQQEQLIRQAQQAQNGVHSSPSGPHAALANAKGMNNAAYLAAMGANGVNSPNPMNGASAASRPPSSGQALSSGHVPVLTQIANKIREHHPNLSDEEVQRLASQQITSYQQQATAAAAGQQQKRGQTHQAALNAAIGAMNAGNHAANAANAANAAAAAQGYPHPGMMTNEQVQQYNQRMRMQQAQQHAARGMQGQMAMNMQGSPAMAMARPVSGHANVNMQGQVSRSATPRDQRAVSQGQGSNPGGVNGQVQQASPRPNPQQPVPQQAMPTQTQT